MRRWRKIIVISPEETVLELKKYFRKLYSVIDEEAIFTLCTAKIINKKKIDDIMCCIDASWPQEYTLFLKKHGVMMLKSNKYYIQLCSAIKNRFWISTDVYAVKYVNALNFIQAILNTIDSDINFVYKKDSNQF